MSYFKQVYRRPTNFSMQSVRTEFNSSPFLSSSRQTFTCTIGRVGDLLKDVSLSLVLPAIYSNDSLRFRWTKNVTNYMLHSYSLLLDTQLLDQRYGEWMDVWNELSLPYDKKVAFNTLTGNTQEYMNPKSLRPRVVIKNNLLSYSSYPISTGQDNPSLASRRVYIPLDFWFCKNPTLAIPLVGLQYQTLSVSLETRSVEELYQVWNSGTGMYVSASQYNALNSSTNGTKPPINISTFTKYGGGGPTIIDLKSHLECNYVFLDTPERNAVASTSTDFLVERVYHDDTKSGVKAATDTVNLTLQNPIKEHVWILRRSDANLYNDWANLTASQPEDMSQPALSTAKILWNGMDRFEEKPHTYFNQLQPYHHHTSSPREGIYVYSYALNPEKVQPSGTFNASTITTIQLQLTANPFPNNATINKSVSTNTEYNLVVYSLQYNVFRVMGGRGNMVFSL